MKELTKMTSHFWKWFRALPPGLQVVGWLFFAPVMTAAYLFQRPGAGKPTKVFALVLLAAAMKTFNMQIDHSKWRKNLGGP